MEKSLQSWKPIARLTNWSFEAAKMLFMEDMLSGERVGMSPRSIPREIKFGLDWMVEINLGMMVDVI